VLDYAGVCWASDLGADDYNMPGYFGAQRFDYYRNNNRSHNTLVIGDKIQDPKAVCNIVEFKSEEGGVTAVCDMTAAYPGQATSVKRTVRLIKSGNDDFFDHKFCIIDKIEGVEEPVRWGMVTRADETILSDGRGAKLNRSGKELRLLLLSPNNAKFEVIPTTPPTEKENQNQGYKMLTVFAEPIDGRVNISVFFVPREGEN